MERPNWWYDPDPEPETPADYGWIHEDDVPDLELCQEMVERVIEAVYTTGDVDALEGFIDELAGLFDVKMPKTDPVLEKKGSVRVDRTLESWLQFNQGYNECLRNQATR